MLLIAENALENQLIPGLTSLLRDFKVDASGFLREEAIAPIFWAAEDVALECASIKGIRKDDIEGILENLESELLEAMILAGFDVIERYLKDTTGAVVYQQHRNLQ